MKKRKGSRKPSRLKGGTKNDLDVVDRAHELIRALPPPEKTYAYREREARAVFEEGLKPLLEHLDALCERHLPEALLPSPCGYSRFGNAICRPWTNLRGCHDLCGRCRRQALRALRLLREGIVDGKPSEKFIPPEIAAALIDRASRAEEREQASSERFMAELRERSRGQRMLWLKTHPTPPEGTPTPAGASPSGVSVPEGHAADLEIRHAPDFSSLRARGKVYHFKTPLQRAVIAALFAEWERVGRVDGCGLTVAALAEALKEAGQGSRLRLRVARLFKGHPAVGTILRKTGRNVWALHMKGPEMAQS